MQRLVHLPTGPEPGWELREAPSGGAQLRTVAESLVVLQSLKQSRNRWIASAFPKFSSKARGGKAVENMPPPHTIKAHGKYDLHIGPHIFSNTALYEVHYLPAMDPDSGQEAQLPHDPQVSTSSSYVTPALSAKVQLAAQTNPTLANLLNAVINHTATDEEVKRLGVLIRQLEDITELGSASIPPPSSTPSVPVRAGSPKPFDLILEFHEKPSDRWILPRGDVFCERVGVADGAWVRYADVIITMCITPSSPPSEPPSIDQQPSDSPTPEVVSFRFSRVPHSLWELLLTWAGGLQKMEESKARLVDLARAAAPPSYLQHRVPEGELLTELQNATAPSYTMKSIKPIGADSTRAKRKSVSRKPTLVIPDTPPTRAEKPTPAKRRQSLKAKTSAPPTPIACHACGQTDVPLMMGGRYCRTCIDAGKTVADVPQAQAAPRGVITPSSSQPDFVPISTSHQAVPFTVQHTGSLAQAKTAPSQVATTSSNPTNSYQIPSSKPSTQSS
ncbi:hypothetical protein BD311DRAFT_746760 [Dichomitus squalens]|uniref:Uncharacterized protein n=1 Tax=Dichomitus squalens TaxID=114155 RepID=A0A4V2K201_9APHY|nr:hypothetical protein BD311DRAFT_746760 [Dichomitus squalens]